MFKTITALCATLLLAGWGGVANAGMITTTFASDNGGAEGWGTFFDLTTFANGINITAMDVNDNDGATSGGNVIIDVYTKVGTFAGNEATAALWTLVSAGSGTGAAEDSPTFIDLTDFMLPANTLSGMFVHHRVGDGPAYTNGDGTNQQFVNADLQLDLGASISGLFNGSLFSDRVANTTIYYDVGSTGPPPSGVPAPVTLALFGLGLAGLGWSRRNKA